MVSCDRFYKALLQHGVDFFTGVPDSLLKDFCAYVADHTSAENHIIEANEGLAVAAACGHFLATSSIGLVYMQNSGLGNAINPLVSLAEVYNIPVLLLIGYRGEPGTKDEPQHVKQGQITLPLLDVLGIPYKILPETSDRAEDCIFEMASIATERSVPVTLVVTKGTFECYTPKHRSNEQFELTREQAIKLVVDSLGPSDIVVSTTGKTSRELYEYREERGHGHDRDFLTVGSMGHCSHIALGIALSALSRQVFCLDGDGAVLMHMGSLTMIGARKVRNFKHIILNNGSHDSVGGQPTVGFSISFIEIAHDCGYTTCLRADSAREVTAKIELLKETQGPALLEIRVNKGARSDLGRPKTSPQQNKAKFMEFLSGQDT